MSRDGSVTRHIADLENGDTDKVSQAQEVLCRQYFVRLIGFAKLKLGDAPRGVADEEDVATAALQSFFAGVANGQFPGLHDRDDLWALLAKIAAHKALDQLRYLLAERRGGGNVRGDSAIAWPSDCSVDEWASLIETELQPDFPALMNEECDRLMAALPNDQLRLIARRRLEGYTNAEIATELKVVERTVERRLQLIRSVWIEELRKDEIV
jgi:DNA-directed RNA polymerase specialized sigma24 family protein